MSTQAIADFILKANEDPDFITKIEGEKAEDRIASLVAAGEEQGFEFTPDECTEFLNTARTLGSGELSEEQLAAVAGGGDLTDDAKLLVGKVWAKITKAIYSTTGQDHDGASAGLPPDDAENAVAGVR